MRSGAGAVCAFTRVDFLLVLFFFKDVLVEFREALLPEVLCATGADCEVPDFAAACPRIAGQTRLKLPASKSPPAARRNAFCEFAKTSIQLLAFTGTTPAPHRRAAS